MSLHYTMSKEETRIKILVSYVFHIYNNRVKYFFKKCIFESSNTDFLIICNDKTIQFEEDLPKFNNILIFKRDNLGYDFGGWSDGLLTNNLYKNYTHFILCNSSIIGPFLKPDFNGMWTDIFINGLYKNNCKLFGSTINTINCPNILSHVQSYIFSLDLEALEYLIKEEIFITGKYSKTLADTVLSKEILMSRKILDNNWNIACLLPMYKNVDFTLKTKNSNDENMYTYGDVMFPSYNGKLWTCEQLVFIKGNRIPTNIDELQF
jgi:hypothetical protein